MFHILLDTEVFRHENLHFSSDRFQTLARLVEDGEAGVYVTDVILGELANAIGTSVSEAVLLLRSNDARRKLGVLVQADKARLSGIVDELDEAALVQELHNCLTALLLRLKATTLSTDSISVAELRERYFCSSPPFSSARNKKHEFPDALTVLAAQEYAQSNQIDLHVVSGDQRVLDACIEGSRLYPVNGLVPMLSTAFDTIEATKATAKAAEIAADALRERLLQAVKTRFSESWLYVEDEGEGDVEDVEVVEVGLNDPEVVSIDGNLATLAFVATISYTATLNVPDPDQTAYDSEDKKLMIFGYLSQTVREEEVVEGNVKIRVDIETPEDSEFLDLLLLQDSFAVAFPWRV